MRTESVVFAGTAGFFLVVDVLYAVWAREPAGTAALTVAFLMALLVSFFFARNHRLNGERPEDRRDGEVRERYGSLGLFPPHSRWPVLTAVGAAVLALGVVYGLWLALLGLGVLAAGVGGLVFQYAAEDDEGR
ncbi:cytochrome c oxidase subunit 4 [Streptomyces sp. NPDC012769]|uniref:aa3-type cytochrome oxidase subunit IV n=1 Tax=Streptomyces sp. NPDC012769 TaxID=3364848 RepID=UPI00369B6EB8